MKQASKRPPDRSSRGPRPILIAVLAVVSASCLASIDDSLLSRPINPDGSHGDASADDGGGNSPVDDRILPLVIGRQWFYEGLQDGGPLTPGSAVCPGSLNAAVIGPGAMHDDAGPTLRY